LRAPHLVTLEAQLGLRPFRRMNVCQRRVEPRVGRKLDALKLMSDVTVDACDVPRFVRTSLPEKPVAPLMTRQAGAVLFVDRISGIFGEADGNGIFATSRLDMSFAGTVAGLAAKPFLLIFGTRERFAHNTVLKVPTLIRMANDTGIAPRVLAA